MHIKENPGFDVHDPEILGPACKLEYFLHLHVHIRMKEVVIGTGVNHSTSHCACCGYYQRRVQDQFGGVTCEEEH